jgi:hypothetical protein
MLKILYDWETVTDRGNLADSYIRQANSTALDLRKVIGGI